MGKMQLRFPNVDMQINSIWEVQTIPFLERVAVSLMSDR